MQVSVVVEEKIKEGQLGEFTEYMREMIRLTKEEEGCIAYDLYEAIDGSFDVVMVEVWESKEALDAHMEAEHFKKYIPGAEAFKESQSKIRVFGRL